MLRKQVTARPDWIEIAQVNGFVFHHVDGETYWDETACWQFTLDEVENRIEDPSTELYGMCLQLVDEACDSQEVMGAAGHSRCHARCGGGQLARR